MSLEDFQESHNPAYQNRKLLAILNRHVAPMPPTKFQLNRTYCLGEDVVWRFSKWLPRLPYWIWKRDDFLQFWISMSPQCLPLSSILQFKRCCFEEFPHWWPSLISERNDFSNSEFPCRPDDFHQFAKTILAILNLYVAPMPSIKFWLNPIYYMGADVVWRVSQDGCHGMELS